MTFRMGGYTYVIGGRRGRRERPRVSPDPNPFPRFRLFWWLP